MTEPVSKYIIRRLMPAPLPDHIDPWKLAAAGTRLQGEVPLAGMARLTPLLNKLDGNVAVDLQGGVDEGGTRFIAGQLNTCVELICQRCLEPLQIALNLELRLGLIRSESQATHLPAEFDPLLALESGITVSTLVEDELILALPFAPMHAENQACQRVGSIPADDQPAEEQTHPFAVLATLRGGGIPR